MEETSTVARVVVRPPRIFHPKPGPPDYLSGVHDYLNRCRLNLSIGHAILQAEAGIFRRQGLAEDSIHCKIAA